ncbi:MAG: hypothetical protein ACI85F_001231 [Bacteroidia bacterium]|jgi:hypothetical protein
MKKYFAIAVFAIGTMSLTSCSSDCCTVSEVKVCESDYTDVAGISWADYKALVVSTGSGTCD